MDAAIDTLKEDGFAGASARRIAERGGMNQALVFYHFATVDRLLLAALDQTSELRMQAYREAIEGADDLTKLTEVAGEVFREDLRSGHITVMAELIAGASAHPELGPEITRRIQPWIELTRDVSSAIIGPLGVGELLPPDDVAYAIVSLFLGIELLSHLEGSTARAERLFAVGQSFATMFGALVGTAGVVASTEETS